MNWFDKLEHKYGRYAIKNLMYYIIGLYAVGFVIQVFWPDVYSMYLSLDAQAILHGQVWRIVTYIIQPPSTSFFWIFFSLYMYYMIGTVLENAWGAFRFNIYFFMGVLLNVIAAIVIYLIFGVKFELSTYYVNLALFMAFATIAPDVQVYLFFIIPVKIKWIAYIDGIYLLLTVICGYLSPLLPANILIGMISLGILSNGYTFEQVYMGSYINATAALISMLNYLIFWLITRKSFTTSGQKAFRKAMRSQPRNPQSAAKPVQPMNQNSQGRGFYRPGTPLRHQCAICKRTEADGDNLEFRYCSRCEGNYEYCNEHLYTHVHIRNDNAGTKTD